MKYVSITELLTLNQKLKKVDLPYQIHLRDTCGKQSLWIECLEEDSDTKKWDREQRLEDLLTEYFSSLQFTIVFSEDRVNFWLQEC